MSISISTSLESTISVSVSGSLAVNFKKSTPSISVKPLAASSTVLTEKLIRSIQVIT